MSVRSNLKNEIVEVTYNKEKWEILEKFQKKALSLMEALRSCNILSIVYGSIARGDVEINSDIDVFITTPISSSMTEIVLDKLDIIPNKRILVQATPFYAPKGYFEIEENVTISLPLVKLKRVEREFYKFAGENNVKGIKVCKRVIGVDKRLMLIEPQKYGHIESNIIGREALVSKTLGISIETVLERVRVLTKRGRTGRTGRFIEMEISKEENFESVLNKLANSNHPLRKRMKIL